MATSQEVKHCTIDDIGIKITGEGAHELIDPINKYLNEFASTDGKCPKCGAKLGGLLGSFTWGLAHGEGICTGGFGDKCGWPCRAYHRPLDENGKEIFDGAIRHVLAYHPEFVSEVASNKAGSQ
jgi:hypothetical protein